MKIYREECLSNFNYWAGAKQMTDYMSYEEFEIIEDIISSEGNEWSEKEINDLFWHDSDWIAEQLGYEDFEEFYERRCK